MSNSVDEKRKAAVRANQIAQWRKRRADLTDYQFDELRLLKEASELSRDDVIKLRQLEPFGVIEETNGCNSRFLIVARLPTDQPVMASFGPQLYRSRPPAQVVSDWLCRVYRLNVLPLTATPLYGPDERPDGKVAAASAFLKRQAD